MAKTQAGRVLERIAAQRKRTVAPHRRWRVCHGPHCLGGVMLPPEAFYTQHSRLCIQCYTYQKMIDAQRALDQARDEYQAMSAKRERILDHSKQIDAASRAAGEREG